MDGSQNAHLETLNPGIPNATQLRVVALETARNRGMGRVWANPLPPQFPPRYLARSPPSRSWDYSPHPTNPVKTQPDPPPRGEQSAWLGSQRRHHQRWGRGPIRRFFRRLQSQVDGGLRRGTLGGRWNRILRHRKEPTPHMSVRQIRTLRYQQLPLPYQWWRQQTGKQGHPAPEGHSW